MILWPIQSIFDFLMMAEQHGEPENGLEVKMVQLDHKDQQVHKENPGAAGSPGAQGNPGTAGSPGVAGSNGFGYQNFYHANTANSVTSPAINYNGSSFNTVQSGLGNKQFQQLQQEQIYLLLQFDIKLELLGKQLKA